MWFFVTECSSRGGCQGQGLDLGSLTVELHLKGSVDLATGAGVW